VSAPLRDLVVPLAVAVLMAQAAPDGRPAHAFAVDWLGRRLRARRRCAGRRVTRDGEPVRWSGVLVLRGDEHASELRCGRVEGPATVTFQVPVRLEPDRSGRLVARGMPDATAGARVELAAGERLEVRP
jgi:hypothetical protein